jgi:hypothetical protein
MLLSHASRSRAQVGAGASCVAVRASRVARVVAAASLLLVASACVAGSAGAQAPSRTAASSSLGVVARAGDAVVTIVAYRDGSSEVTSGTGVRVTDGRVITALRHLRGASRAEVYGASGELLATVTTLDQAEVALDLAVMPRITTTGERITLARRSAVPSQKVSLLGPKKGTTRSVAERTVTHVEPDASGRALLRLGAAVTGTASGSPVVNARGELIAIALGVIPGKDEGDVAVDVTAIRDLLARPSVRLGLPARDGTVAAARAVVESKPAATVPAATTRAASEPNARPRSSIFPERYGTPVSADTAGAWAVELFGCARLESRQKVYCYLRVTNLAKRESFGVKGGDLVDSTRRKLRSADNLVFGDSSLRVAGWRTKAQLPLRELESARIALEFVPPARDSDAVRLMLDIDGERTLWLGPFVLQRAP